MKWWDRYLPGHCRLLIDRAIASELSRLRCNRCLLPNLLQASVKSHIGRVDAVVSDVGNQGASCPSSRICCCDGDGVHGVISLPGSCSARR